MKGTCLDDNRVVRHTSTILPPTQSYEQSINRLRSKHAWRPIQK